MDSATLLTDNRVRLLGPFRPSPNAGFRTGWQTGATEVEFTGTTLSVTLGKKVIDSSVAYLSSIYVYVDDANAIVSAFSPNNINETIYESAPVTFRYVASATPQTYLVASGLSNTRHRARICFMEGNSYVIAYELAYSDVVSISTDGTIHQWTPKGPLVECIGDSITGIADAWPNHMGIEAVVLGHGGMALAGVGVGGGPKTIPPATVFYPYSIMPGYPSTTGSYTRIDDKCVAAVVFFGTNDIALGYTAANFKTAMQSLISSIRTRNADANLPVVMVRPMYNSDPSNYGAQLASIAAADPNAHYYDTQPLWATMTYYDGTHPDAPGSRLLANGMTGVLTPYLPAKATSQVWVNGAWVAASPEVWNGSTYVTGQIGV